MNLHHRFSRNISILFLLGLTVLASAVYYFSAKAESILADAASRADSIFEGF